MIIWKFKDSVTDQTKCAQEIKEALEGLVGKIEGLLEMRILTNGMDSSSGDLMMDSTFLSRAALEEYQKHPLHQAVANQFVRPVMEQRLSFDYER
jgi:hypothetical protein